MITKPQGTPRNRKLAPASSQRTQTAVPRPIPERKPANQPVAAPPKLRVVPSPVSPPKAVPPPIPTRPPPIPTHRSEPVQTPTRPVHQQKTRKVMAPPRADVGSKKPSRMAGRILLIVLMVVFTAGILAWQNGYVYVAREKIQLALTEHQKKIVEDSAKSVAEAKAAKERSEVDAATASQKAAEANSSAASWQAEAQKNGQAYATEHQKRLELEEKVAALEKAKTELEARYTAADQQLTATATKLNEVNDLLNKNKAQKRIRAMVRENVQLETRKRELEEKLAKVTGEKTRLETAVKKARGQLDLIKMQQEEVGGRIAWLETEARKVPGLSNELASVKAEFALYKQQAAKMSKYPAPGSKEEFITWMRMQLALNESSWNFEAVGDPIVNKDGKVIINPKTKKPYRAYGFTQQHEKYLPERTEKYCGSVRTPQQFLKDKTCQIAVELGMLEQYYDECPADWTRKSYCIAGKWIGGGANLRTSDGNVTKAEYMFMVHKSPDSKKKGTWDQLVARVTKMFGNGSQEPAKPSPKKKSGKSTRVAKK